MRRRSAALLAGLLVGLVALVGCAELPVSGPVRHESAAGSGESLEAPYFDPPGPALDGSPSAIVSGFLTALQANPLSTKVARQFLSERVRSTWQPNGGTLVYEAFTVLPSDGGVSVRLSDVRRLDARGGWEGGTPGGSQVLDMSLVSEGGQWRIDNPPSSLIVPASFFERAFERTNLYFFDQTGRVLLPDPVFVPRGEQSATDLVRGLLAGPGRTLSDVTTTAFPRGTDLELSVVVTESGVAEVPLTRELLRASAADLGRARDQLVWTLGQVPGIQRVRMTVGGAPVPVADGEIDAEVTRSGPLDAGGPPEPELYAVRDDRLVALSADGRRAVAGPLGEGDFAPRSLAVGGDPATVAGVTSAGTRLVLAPLEADGGVEGVLSGTDLGRPSIDVFGNVWVLDRTSAGARVWLVERDGAAASARQVEVDGVSGRDVAAVTIARDGSRLAVAFADGRADGPAVVDVLRTEEGSVAGTGRPRVLDLPGADDLALLDVGWHDPETVAVLSRTGEETSRVDLLSTDGSPLGPTGLDSATFRGAATALVVAPGADADLGVLAESGVLYTLGARSTWARGPSELQAAAYGG